MDAGDGHGYAATVRYRGRLVRALVVTTGVGAIGLAMVLAALPLTVTGPRGTVEQCGPSIFYFAPVDPIGIRPGSDEYAIFEACKTAALHRNGWVLLSGFLGFLVVGWAVISYLVRMSRRTPT
jgi:hypothetical protein